MDVGSVIDGVVTGITDFGAFVKLSNGETGLVHISEVADEFVKDVRAYLNEEQAVQVKVLGVNKKGKYELSIKQVSSGPQPEAAPRRSPRAPSKSNQEVGFEDMVSKWKKESEERLLDVRRNKDAKRGGSSRRGGR